MLISSSVSYHEFHMTGTYIFTDGSSYLLPIQGPGKVTPLQFAETMGAVPRAAPCSNFCRHWGLYAGRRRWHEGHLDPNPAGGDDSRRCGEQEALREVHRPCWVNTTPLLLHLVFQDLTS